MTYCSVGEPAEGSLPWGFGPIEIAPFVYEYPCFLGGLARHEDIKTLCSSSNFS